MITVLLIVKVGKRRLGLVAYITLIYSIKREKKVTE